MSQGVASADGRAASPCPVMRIDVCVATYKRAQLLGELLRDLRAQQLPPAVTAQVIVVDNDAEESARGVVAASQDASMPVAYLVEPTRSIARARNRALEHAQGDLLAFIDDDESAPPRWLATLLATMERHRADVVLGPVNGRLPPDAPAWIRQGRFFERPARASGTRVKLGGTGNALVRASAVRGKLAFDSRYGLSGSEDTDFFFRLWQAGACMVWCQEAMLTEAVPADRLNARWLLERGFGAGQGYADIVDRPRGGVRVLAWCARRGGLALVGGLLTVAWLPFSKARAVRYAIKGVTNLGQLSTVLPFRHQAYRGWAG